MGAAGRGADGSAHFRSPPSQRRGSADASMEFPRGRRGTVNSEVELAAADRLRDFDAEMMSVAATTDDGRSPVGCRGAWWRRRSKLDRAPRRGRVMSRGFGIRPERSVSRGATLNPDPLGGGWKRLGCRQEYQGDGHGDGGGDGGTRCIHGVSWCACISVGGRRVVAKGRGV